MFGATSFAIGTVPVLIVAGHPGPAKPVQARIKNVTGTATICLGGTGISATVGYPWAPADGAILVDAKRQQDLYASTTVAVQTVWRLADLQ